MANLRCCGTVRVFLIAGQSNAVGAAGRSQDAFVPGMNLSGRYLPYANPVNGRKVCYAERILNNNTGQIIRDIPAFGVVQPYQTAPFDGRHGVELSLARYLKNVRQPHWSPNDEIVLLKFASGGTGIDRWLPSDTSGLHQQFDSWLRDMLSTIGQSCEYTCEKLFWLQGEANTGNGASTYLSRFQQFESYLNTVCDFTPVFSKLKYWPNDPSRDAGIDIVNADMGANYKCTVDNNDLNFLPNEIHYTANDYMRLGLRLGFAANC